MVLLIIPLFQYFVPTIEEKPLLGEFKLAEKPDSMLENWFSGDFQIKYEKYFNDYMGFRNFFVKVNNQMDYSFFNISHADKVVVGKDNYLYEKNYIEAYFGTDFAGEKQIETNIKTLKNIHNTLKNKGKELIIVFAPSKASYLPEFLPAKNDGRKRSTTNYEVLKKHLINQKFNFVDFDGLFIQMKDTTKYPLYSKTGVHWSNYGMTLAFDSLIRYMENVKQISLPDLKITNIEQPDTTRDTDYDIASAMNLLFTIPQFKLAYPIVTFETKPNTVKPKAIVIGDSYYFNIFNAYDKFVFSEIQFWYYLKSVHQHNQAVKDISEIDITQEIEKTDFVIILATELNLNWFPFGFNEKYSTVDESEILKIEIEIKNTPQWFELIKKQATQRNLSVEQILRENAIYTLNMRKITPSK